MIGLLATLYHKSVIVHTLYNFPCMELPNFEAAGAAPLLGLDAFGVYLAQAHVNICPRRHELVFCRTVFSHAGWRRNERYVVVASEKEGNRVSVLERGEDPMCGRHENVVYQSADIPSGQVRQIACWSISRTGLRC